MFCMQNEVINKFRNLGLYSESDSRSYELYLSDFLKGNSFASVRLFNVRNEFFKKDISKLDKNRLLRTRIFK